MGFLFKKKGVKKAVNLRLTTSVFCMTDLLNDQEFRTTVFLVACFFFSVGSHA